MPEIQLITPEQFDGVGEQGPYPIDQFPLRFLAQGDSWFSIGALPPWLTSNLFDKMTLSVGAVAVNCASPGAKLVRMIDSTKNKTFLRLLNGKATVRWTALLLSGLGNDVIEASQSPPGSHPKDRLLARKDEWEPGVAVSRYISEPGWATFETHARGVFQRLLEQRDKTAINRGIPIVVHTYDFTTPRNAPAGPKLGPWLYRAVKAFEVPEEDWLAVAKELLVRTGRLIESIGGTDATVHVVRTQGTLTPAMTSSTGPTAHWQNEIHPTRTGYRLLGDVWEQELERLFRGSLPT